MKHTIISVIVILVLFLLPSCGSGKKATGGNVAQDVSSREKDAHFESIQQAKSILPDATQSADTQVRIVEWTDFIRWNDISYQGSGVFSGVYVFVPDELIADKLGEITLIAPTEVSGEIEMENGMAGWRKPGTEFFSIRGYSQDNYIAVFVNGKYLLYKTRESEDIPFPDSGYWSDSTPTVVSIGSVEISEPTPITMEPIAGQNMSKPTDNPAVSLEVIGMSEFQKLEKPDLPPNEVFPIPQVEITPSSFSTIDIDGIQRIEIEPEGEFIALAFNLPNGFSTVMTLHQGSQSVYHIASPDGIVFMNLQYIQTRFGLGEAPKAYFSQYDEIELVGYPIFNTYSEEHGAFVTFEADGILYTLSGGIDGDNSMKNLFSLCEAIING
jgi:hypothetical protein